MKVVTLNTKELRDLLKEDNLLPFNRNISDKHVEKMSKSIADCGILRLPVIGNLTYKKNKKAIIDGQHLVASVLKDNSIKEIQCIIKDYDNKREVISDVSKLNNTQKTWKDSDFLDAWYRYGMDDYSFHQNYAYLKEKHDRYNLPCTFLIDLFAKNKNNFKLGKLEFRNFKLSNVLLDLSDKLQSEFNMPSHSLHGLRVWAFNREGKETDFVKLESRLLHALRSKEINHRISRDEFVEELSRLYTRL